MRASKSQAQLSLFRWLYRLSNGLTPVPSKPKPMATGMLLRDAVLEAKLRFGFAAYDNLKQFGL